jgi:hypothetical protein
MILFIPFLPKNIRPLQTKPTEYFIVNTNQIEIQHGMYFFDIKDDIYLIKNIVNNHSKDYPLYISGF